MATVNLKGNAIHTNGDLPAVGNQLPAFRLVDKDLNDKTLETWAGKKKLISIVPSLDTGVCATSTKKFEELVANQNDIVVLIISADLPFAQARYCTAENLSNVETLSMMRSRSFAKDYGVLLEDGPLAGITGRAVIVANGDNKVLYTELVPEITQEPDYDKAMSALAQ